MVRKGDVWDRTAQVLSGRGRTLAGIAAGAIFLPGVVRAAYAVYVGKDTPATAMVGGLIAIVVSLLAVWAQLVLIALSTDPATTQPQAFATGRTRLLPTIGVGLVIGLVFAIFIVPIFVALVGVGWTPEAMQAGQMPVLTSGVASFVALYGLAYIVAFLWFAARLAVWTAVMVNERLGLGTIARSFALTRGVTWKIVGVFLLYLIVMLVAASAATAVTGVVFGLILGTAAKATVGLIAAIVGGAVTAAFSTVAATFTAQLYVAVREPDWASTFA